MAKNASSGEESSGKSTATGSKWLAVLRIYLGSYFIHQSLGKFTASYIGEFSRLVGRWSHDSSYEWYRVFLDQCVLPHAKFFAYFTAISEFYVGITLIIGFLSGLAAILGIFLYANYTLGESSGNFVWDYGMVIICLTVVIFTGAGRTLGFDKYLSKKILFKYLV